MAKEKKKKQPPKYLIWFLLKYLFGDLCFKTSVEFISLTVVVCCLLDLCWLSTQQSEFFLIQSIWCMFLDMKLPVLFNVTR